MDHTGMRMTIITVGLFYSNVSNHDVGFLVQRDDDDS